MRFEPTYTEMFQGGNFDLGNPKTLGELRAALVEMEKEMSTWGDDNTKLAEIHLDQEHQKIRVSLDEGIPQP